MEGQRGTDEFLDKKCMDSMDSMDKQMETVLKKNIICTKTEVLEKYSNYLWGGGQNVNGKIE